MNLKKATTRSLVKKILQIINDKQTKTNYRYLHILSELRRRNFSMYNNINQLANWNKFGIIKGDF